MKHNIYQELKIKKGNVYSYLSDDEKQWLIEEAVKMDRCDVGLVIASIVTDAYVEEKEKLLNDDMKRIINAARVYE